MASTVLIDFSGSNSIGRLNTPKRTESKLNIFYMTTCWRKSKIKNSVWLGLASERKRFHKIGFQRKCVIGYNNEGYVGTVHVTFLVEVYSKYCFPVFSKVNSWQIHHQLKSGHYIPH